MIESSTGNNYYVYILTNKWNKVLYTGFTNSLLERVHEHKMKKVDGFTKKYNVDKLVYYEEFEQVQDAINMEKQIKNYSREKKIALIESMNPEWKDLYDGLLESWGPVIGKPGNTRLLEE
ncbi:GIY-YIG nuclease family protein [bacterium]|nr:GIY-YIG nuclease family protein [bacterium]